MKTVTPPDLRNQWGKMLDEVFNSDEALAIPFRAGKPEAVLMTYETWLEGERQVGVPESRRRSWKASELRLRLREAREAAHRDGEHALIERWGKVQLALAPYDWVLKALPRLGEAEQPDPAGQRYGKSHANPQD
ncbi:hypothetical protein ACW9HH_35970 [Nocardia gipuzkoensis]